MEFGREIIKKNINILYKFFESTLSRFFRNWLTQKNYLGKSLRLISKKDIQRQIPCPLVVTIELYQKKKKKMHSKFVQSVILIAILFDVKFF